MLTKYFKKSFFSKSIQWIIIEKLFLGAILSTGFTLMGFRLKTIALNNALIVPSSTLNIVINVVISLASALLIAFTIGLPLGRGIKEELTVLKEAHEAICRGRIDIRLTEVDYIEITQINHEFNCVADHTKKQVESLQRLTNENNLLLQNAEEAATIGERKKIARELHDAISQQLFAISITLGAIKNLIDHKPQEARKYFDKVENMVHLAQQELRALIMHLRPASLNGAPFPEGLSKLLKELDEKNKNINIRWEIEEVVNLSTGIEDNLFRVVQEAISNVLRHAKATSLSIKLFNRNNLLSIYIEDNGIGFDNYQTKFSSYGILSMKERIADIGGRLDILSYPGKGTRLEIRVPI